MILELFLSISLFSFDNLSFDKNQIKKIDIPKVSKSEFMLYITDEKFSFEKDALKKCKERENIFKNYGIGTIGCNVIESGNAYTFTIEYLPELKNPELITPMLIETYIPSKTYWNENLAKKEMTNSINKFNTSHLKPIDFKVIENSNEYTFKIIYAVKNILNKSKNYYVKFEKFIYGKYAFESEANKDIYNVLNNLKQAGISAINGKVIENNNDYSIEIEYLTKTEKLNVINKKPEYEIQSYKNEERFPFEQNALNEAIKRNEAFSKANISVIHNYAYQNDNDWSFVIDFVVKNIYKNGSLIVKEVSIKRYNSTQVFDFENEAEEAMNDKIESLNSLGLYVVGYKITEVGNNYSFYIDYISKNLTSNFAPKKDSKTKPGNCTTPIELNPEEAYYFIIEKKPIIIDIRTKQEYEQEHLENVSYNIDFYSPHFKDHLNDLDKNAKYLIYCRTGRRSAQALEIMKELGFKDIHHIKGGIVAWKEAGYPTVK